MRLLAKIAQMREEAAMPTTVKPTMVNPANYGYHAHVYFNEETRPVAVRLAERLNAEFDVEIGQFSGDRVGPHPIPQFQMIFKNEQFATVVPWLMLNRDGLDILLHPLTDDMVDDHTVYATWLGKPIDLLLDHMQRRGYRDALLPKEQAAA
jgi:aromatic ring-cleaving dioxygenase